MQRLQPHIGTLRNPGILLKGLFVALGTLGVVDFVTYSRYEKQRKRVTRITESFKDKFGGQMEILRSNLGLLITPCFNNIHAFDQYNKSDDDYATSVNFKELLDKYTDWSQTILSFKNIPETQLILMSEYWDVFRKEPYFIKDKYHIYRLFVDDFNCNLDIPNKNIIYDELKDKDLDEILKMNENNNKIDKFYMDQVIASERVSIGAYDTEKDNKLIGYSFVNMDDLSASNIVIDNEYKEKDDAVDIALKLGQLTVSQHFDQGYDHINANIDVDDLDSAQMRQDMGFKKLPETYYWIETMHTMK